MTIAQLTGPDVSRHQGLIAWPAVKLAGHSFAFCKLTDGTNYGWVTWGRGNLLAVKAVGLIPGAYHWLDRAHDGAAQARYFVSELNKAVGIPGTLCAVDVEKDSDGTWPTIGQVRDFAAEWNRLTSELVDAGTELVILPTYTAMLALRAVLTERGFVQPYWDGATP